MTRSVAVSGINREERVFRSFNWGQVRANIPEEIRGSIELYEYLRRGVDVTQIYKPTSKWYFYDGIVGSRGEVKEFLLMREADEDITLSDGSTETILGMFT